MSRSCTSHGLIRFRFLRYTRPIMKKEYFFIFTVALLIFAYVIDAISGPINLVILLSLFGKLFFAKAISSFLLAALLNLFAIQQIATNTRTVTLQWNLSLAFAGLALLLPTVIYLIIGLISPVLKHGPVQGTPTDDSETQ